MRTCKIKGWKIGRWEDLFHPPIFQPPGKRFHALPSFLFSAIISRQLFNLTYVLAVLRPVPPTLSMLVSDLQ